MVNHERSSRFGAWFPRGWEIRVPRGIGAKQLLPSRPPLHLSFLSIRDGKLAMIRLLVLVRGLRNAGGSFSSSVARPVFSVAKISCREEASLLAFFIGFEAAVESRSSVHGCTCGNCKHFQPSWNLVVEFCHWLQIAHLSWKCLVRVCRRLGNVIRMFCRRERERERYVLYTTRWTFRFRNSGFIDDYLSDWRVIMSSKNSQIREKTSSRIQISRQILENANVFATTLIVTCPRNRFRGFPDFLRFPRNWLNVAPDSVVFGRIFPIRLRNTGNASLSLCPKSYKFVIDVWSNESTRSHLIEGLSFRVNHQASY